MGNSFEPATFAFISIDISNKMSIEICYFPLKTTFALLPTCIGLEQTLMRLQFVKPTMYTSKHNKNGSICVLYGYYY